MKRTALLLTLLLPLAACKPDTAAPQTADTPAPPSTTPSAAAEAAAVEASASPATTPAAAEATTSASATPTPADSTNTAAKLATGFNATGALAPGVDYAEIQGGQPFEPRNGKVEVVEVFGYVCPACFRFQPQVTAWEKTLPADVRFTYVPAQFAPEWIPYAHAFYVSQSMGLVAKTHEAMFNAIHVAGTLPGEGKKPDEAAIAKFYGKYGADPRQFADAMHSFAVDAKLTHAKQFVVQSGVQGTPTIVVDGKYRVIGKSYDDMLRITNQLITQERAAGAAHP